MRGADLDRLAQAARRAAEREAEGRADPEPSLGARLGRTLGTGIFFSAPLLMAGAAFGFWLAWRWMHRQGLR